MTDQSVSFLYIWLLREDVRDCGGLRSLRSLRTLPTFPAWSSTTCLRRAPLFGSQCLRRRNSRSMIAPWQMVPGGPSHFVGPFFSGANASRHHLPRSIADKHLHFNHYDPSHNLLGTATLPTGAPEPSRRAEGGLWTVCDTATMPTGTSVASSRSHCELVYRIVAVLCFVKFT